MSEDLTRRPGSRPDDGDGDSLLPPGVMLISLMVVFQEWGQSLVYFLALGSAISP
jgi:hypothetical protein